MLLTSSPVHRLEPPLVGGRDTSACRLQRRYTFSEPRSIRMQNQRQKRPLMRARPTKLDSVIEQSDSFHDCSQQPEDRVGKKHYAVGDICETGHGRLPIGKASTLPRNFARKHTDLVNGMAWKSGKQQHCSSSTNSSSDSSWLEKLTEKRRKSGLFGSLRGRSKEKKKDNPPTPETSNGSPKSPLLGKNRTRSDTDPAKTKRKVLQIKRSGDPELHGSTGFHPTDNVDLTDSNTDQQLVYEIPSLTPPSLNHGHHGPGVKRVSHVRKANSLPRTVLCSPVMTRKSTRPSSQWLNKEFLVDDRSPSPCSSNMSSRIGSVDTLQPSNNVSEDYGFLSVNTPTAIEGWQAIPSTRCELVHKTSLTRSSSLPFEADILSEQSLGKEVSDKVMSGEHGARFATRSQSFNTHFNSHSVIQKTSSYEEMIMRERVLSFLLETEQSYIQSLRTLTKNYKSLLSANGLLEDVSVREIFLAVEELTALHEGFATRVDRRVSNWTSSQIVGDVLQSMFSSPQLVTVYSQFIQFYSNARHAIESCTNSKPSLAKDLEDCSRDNQNKLGLKDLLIKPVQRIPRYMLFVKDIIKYTSHAHPDYPLLQEALSELTQLADCVNETERVSDKLQQHKELLSTVDGLAECVTSSSVFLRCDVITEMKGSVHRKDRLLLLFSDAVVCAGRRRSTGFRRGSLMNINSTQNNTETTRYRVKWCSSLSSLSVTHSQAPLFERRRYNTLEKLLHNSQKDEGLLIQMMALSSNLHCDHNQLNTVLQDMLDQLRSGMSNRQQEMETLPHDSARLDLISHDSSPASKYFLVFSTQKERQQWEQALRNAQLSSTSSPLITRLRLEDDHSVPSSPCVQRHSSVKSPSPHFLSHLSLPSCRVGSQLSSSAVSVGPNSQQLFITINDTCGRGSVAIISTTNGMVPWLIATLPLSSSNLLCALCVQYPTGCHDDCYSEKSFSLSESGDIHFFNGYPDACSTPLSAANEGSLLKSDQFDMLRSSSAPPASFKTLMESNQNGWGPIASTSNTQPSGSAADQWLWLGSEGGVIYLLKMGVSSLHVGTSISFNLKAPVECLLAHNNRVWAGLRDGRIAMFHLIPEVSYEYISISTKRNPHPVSCLSPAGHMIFAATGNMIIGISSLTGDHKEQLELAAHHKIGGVVVSGNLVFVSVQDTLMVFICCVNESSLEVLCTLDCTNTVLSALKNYDSIVKQHKCSYPRITSMTSTDNMLVVGTSTGVLVYLPLPLIPGHTPSPQALVKGQVDEVSILNVMATEGQGHMLVSGGHGLEDLLKCQVSNKASETEGCLLFWRVPSN